MKPTPEMIEVACKAHTPQFDRMDPDLQVYARQQMAAALSAALSVPAAAVVGEPGPIGYCSEYGLDKLASQAHHYCLSVSKAQENEFQFPIYAAPSAPDGWQPISSAPMDGTRVLLWTTTRNPEDQQYVDDVLDGEHVEERQIGYFSGQEWVCERIGHPSHWRPLPPRPELGGE